MKFFILVLFSLLTSFNYSQNCSGIILDTTLIKRDSVNLNHGSYYLSFNNEKETDFEITLNVNGGLPGNDLLRIFCVNDTIKVQCYYFNHETDSINYEINEDNYKLFGIQKLQLIELTYQNFIDSLVSYDFFTLKNMDSTMKIKRDTLSNGDIRVNEYRVWNYSCNKIDYCFEYKIGNITRTYTYEGLYDYYRVMPNKYEFQKAMKIANLFRNHLKDVGEMDYRVKPKY